MTMIEQLRSWGACTEGLSFAENYTSWQELWAGLNRADWMFWLLGKLDCPQQELSLACAAAIKPEVYHLLCDERSKAVFTAVPAYWRGEIDRHEMQAVSDAAWDAGSAAGAAWAATWAAWAAAWAAWVAGAAGEMGAWTAAWAAAEVAAWAATGDAVWAAAWAGAEAAEATRDAAWAAEAAAHRRMCERIRREVDFTDGEDPEDYIQRLRGEPEVSP